jgi:hypothetical protein
VGELLDAWYEFAAPDFSPKTCGYIDRSLMPALGTRAVQAEGQPISTRSTVRYSRRMVPAAGRWRRERSDESTASCGEHSTRV